MYYWIYDTITNVKYTVGNDGDIPSEYHAVCHYTYYSEWYRVSSERAESGITHRL